MTSRHNFEIYKQNKNILQLINGWFDSGCIGPDVRVLHATGWSTGVTSSYRYYPACTNERLIAALDRCRHRAGSNSALI